MKNKSFIVIIFISLIIFIALLFSIYKFVLKDTTKFYADGFVSITDSEVSEKIYFNSGTSYKKGYNEDIIFKSKDNVKENISMYSFAYYNNKSISYLSDGVLMDLDKVNSSFIPYYNIKSNYIIEYKDNKYTIESTENNIVLNNFIGRISDSKYIVAGNNLNLKLSSSDETVSGYYFELNFKDGNIVKIDNEEINLETISDECYIMVGDHTKIDLSKRIIEYDDELKVNLSEIIINNDSNIDILYKEKEEENPSTEGDGTNEPQTPAVIDQYEVETVVDYKNVPYVEIVGTSINSNSLNLNFRVLDPHNLINSTIKVKYLNLLSGVSNIKEFNNTSEVIDFIADGLQSESKYLVTIYTSYVRNNNVFNDYVLFQRTFTTGKLGINLAKDYASSSNLAFNLSFENDSSVTGGELNLYDEDNNLIDTIDFTNNNQETSHVFENLDSNKKYTAKVENIIINGVNYPDGYAVLKQDKTLKYNPFEDEEIILQPTAEVNKIDYYIKFDLNAYNDMDKAITNVTYNIYEKETNLLVKSINKKDTSSIEVEIDDDVKANTTYYYNAVITMNDNEKELDYTTINSNDFNMDNKISPTLVFKNGEISANTISGLFIITDPDNTIDITKNVYVEYNDSLGTANSKFLTFTTCPENSSETTKCAELELSELQSDEVYTTRLMAYVDLNDEELLPGYSQVGAVKITTKEADIVLTSMNATDLDESAALEKIFEVNINFSLDAGVPEAIRDNMSGFDIVLYEGADAIGTYLGTKHVGEETNIVEELFNGTKSFTLSDFGLTLEDLRRLHILDNGQISKKYTIKLTNGRSGADYIEFKPYLLTFEINEVLLGLSNDDATIEVTKVLNNASHPSHTSELKEDTIIGIKATPTFGNKPYVTKINYKVVDVTSGTDGTYITETEAVDLSEGSVIPNHEFIFEDYPEFFARGHVYVVTYTVSLDLNEDGVDDIEYPFESDNMSVPKPVRSTELEAQKQNPSIVMFPWTSSSNTIVYKYRIDDIDNALVNIAYSVGENKKNPNTVNCDSNISNYQTKYLCMELFELNKNDIYSIYLNSKVIDRDNYELSVVPGNTYKFDGLYESNDLSDITYEILKNEDGKLKYNNMLAIKVYSTSFEALSEEEKLNSNSLLNRISQYNISFGMGTKSFSISNINDSALESGPTDPLSYSKVIYTDTSNGTTNSANMNKLAYVAPCDENGGTCIFIDYSKLYNSSVFKNNFSALKNQDMTINLSVEYDTGKIGYLASTQNNYAFRVDSFEPITNAGVTYNDNYLILQRSNATRAKFKLSALSAMYKYVPGSKGFVDDDTSDNNGLTGNLYFENTIYTSFNKLTYPYKVTAKGVEVNFNTTTGYLPVVAKELSSTTINSDDSTFAYEKVVPSLSVLDKNTTINGIKLYMNITGITDSDIDDESGKKNLYLEVYDLENTKIQTIKINKDELISQTGTAHKNQSYDINGVINNNKYTLKAFDLSKVTINSIKVDGEVINNSKYSFDNTSGAITFADSINNGTLVEINYKTSNVTYKVRTDSNYYLDLSIVNVDGEAVTDYSYDYLTGIISLDDDCDGKSINLTYQIVINSLDVNTSYYIKAFMKMNGNDNYLISTASEPYVDFNLAFNTKNTTDVVITNSSFSKISDSNYINRALTTNYTIDDIMGFENLSYNICNADSSSCVDVTSYSKCSNNYNYFDGTCIEKDGKYNMNIIHDISKTIEQDFIFNTNYNMIINAKVRTTDGLVHDYEIYNKAINISALEEPTINVGRESHFKKDQSGNDNYYLTFNISFDDKDRVISAFDKEITDVNGNAIDSIHGNAIDSIHGNAGEYIVYLVEGSNRDVVQNVKDVNGNSIDTYQVLSVTDNNHVNHTSEITFGYLNENTEYYLMVEYHTYRNNADLEPLQKNKTYVIPYLLYTQNNYNISIGKTEFVPLCATSKLRFAYATNLMPRYIYNEATGANDLLDPNQEAYVTGILYNVSRLSGDATSVVDDTTIIFTDENENDIIYTKNENHETEIGDYYYEIAIPGTNYPVSDVMYGINYKFYIGGNIMRSLDNKEACEDNSPTNYWDTNEGKCYKLEQNWYNANAIFGGTSCVN